MKEYIVEIQRIIFNKNKLTKDEINSIVDITQKMYKEDAQYNIDRVIKFSKGLNKINKDIVNKKFNLVELFDENNQVTTIEKNNVRMMVYSTTFNVFNTTSEFVIITESNSIIPESYLEERVLICNYIMYLLNTYMHTYDNVKNQIDFILDTINKYDNKHKIKYEYDPNKYILFIKDKV